MTTRINMTAEVFYTTPDGNSRLELVRGEVIEKPFNGGLHGLVTANIGVLLNAWANENTRGCVGIGSWFVLTRDPDTVRASDVYFIRAERVTEAGGIPEAFWQIAPDLMVEVVSPNDSAEDVLEKISDYLLAGTPLVWVVYPRTRAVMEHTPDGLAHTRTENDTLENADVLPGFSCVVHELFE
jgi:Uma2 family endonuclease